MDSTLSASSSRGFDSLPDELVLNIFAFVDSFTLLTAVPCVCRRWRSLCGDTPDVVFDLSGLMKVRSRAAFFMHVGDAIGGRMAYELARRFRHLVAAKFWVYETSYNIGLLDVVSDEMVEGVAMGSPGLQSIECAYKLTDASALALAHNCPLLKEIHLVNICGLTDGALIGLARHCPRLTSVTLRNCRELTEEGVIGLAQHCSRLTCIDFTSSARSITNASVLAFAQHCPMLTSFCVDCCYDVMDEGIVELAARCPALATVNLSRCMHITDAAIVALAQHCPRLESINVSECAITDESVLALASHCPSLSKADFFFCDQLTSDAAVTLVSKCTKLDVVDFSNCSHLTDAVVVTLLNHCPLLNCADFNNCGELTDAAVATVSHPNLTQIWFEGCVQMTRETLLEFARRCPRLEQLVLPDGEELLDF